MGICVSDAELDAYFTEKGITKEQAAANLRKRFPTYSEEKIQEELEVGLLCEHVLDAFKRLAQEKPEVFWNDEPFMYI